MGLWRRLFVVLGLWALTAGSAAADEGVLNKEGFWRIAARQTSCAASMRISDGTYMMLNGEGGQLSFAYVLAKPVVRGQKAEFQTEAWRFDFTPAYNDGNDVVFLDGVMAEKAITALRAAKRAPIVVDGTPLAGATLEGTGVDGVLDALVACSQGQSGWWGEGWKQAG